jgi:hypothetical protein
VNEIIENLRPSALPTGSLPSPLSPMAHAEAVGFGHVGSAGFGSAGFGIGREGIFAIEMQIGTYLFGTTPIRTTATSTNGKDNSIITTATGDGSAQAQCVQLAQVADTATKKAVLGVQVSGVPPRGRPV